MKDSQFLLKNKTILRFQIYDVITECISRNDFSAVQFFNIFRHT